MENIFSIKNRVVLVTGAGRGIGLHLAKEMAKCGAFVYGIDKQFSKKIPKKLEKKLFQIKCDVTEDIDFSKICEQIFFKHKKINVLINNAGVSYAIQEQSKLYPKEKWDDTIKVNLTAAFTCSQSVIKYMKKNNEGSIINITSIIAELGFPRNPAYVASKGGLKMLGKALAKDWGKFGIRVNSVGPGYTKTDMTMRRFLDKKSRKKRQERALLGRWGEVDDLVGPCIFLASDAARNVTGIDLYVDGGWIANGLVE